MILKSSRKGRLQYTAYSDKLVIWIFGVNNT